MEPRSPVSLEPRTPDPTYTRAGWWVIGSVLIKTIAPALSFVWLSGWKSIVLPALFILGNVVGSITTQKLVNAELTNRLKEFKRQCN